MPRGGKLIGGPVTRRPTRACYARTGWYVARSTPVLRVVECTSLEAHVLG
jgi:hypothetical protein